MLGRENSISGIGVRKRKGADHLGQPLFRGRKHEWVMLITLVVLFPIALNTHMMQESDAGCDKGLVNNR